MHAPASDTRGGVARFKNADRQPTLDHESRAARAVHALAVRAGAAAFAAAVLACASAPTSPAASSRGSLVIVGGGPIPEAVIERFVSLAGGPGRARIVIFPMASESEDAGLELADHFRRLGAEAERLVLTHEQADSEDAVRRVDAATGIWFGGGDQSRLTKALLHTRVDAAIRNRYETGAAVGGTSAGAAVMSTPMLTGDERHPGGSRPPAKDSDDAYMTIARDNVVTAEGFALLPGAIVDQHFLRRRRHNRLISLVLENPGLVGVGIDESTALEVEPSGRWRILGESVAFVLDARAAEITATGSSALGATGLRLSILPAGSTYEPATGKATLPNGTP